MRERERKRAVRREGSEGERGGSERERERERAVRREGSEGERERGGAVRGSSVSTCLIPCQGGQIDKLFCRTSSPDEIDSRIHDIYQANHPNTRRLHVRIVHVHVLGSTNYETCCRHLRSMVFGQNLKNLTLAKKDTI